jgi:hypothetical protein
MSYDLLPVGEGGEGCHNHFNCWKWCTGSSIFTCALTCLELCPIPLVGSIVGTPISALEGVVLDAGIDYIAELIKEEPPPG